MKNIRNLEEALDVIERERWEQRDDLEAITLPFMAYRSNREYNCELYKAHEIEE